jgi:hypothetical protein
MAQTSAQRMRLDFCCCALSMHRFVLVVRGRAELILVYIADALGLTLARI